MSPRRFDRALGWLLVNEGTEFVDDPDDRGGATRYGITQGSLAVWRGRPVTKDEVRDLTLDEAGRFYESTYWQPLQADAIDDELKALALFDLAVLTGVPRAVRLAQAVCKLRETGVPSGDLVTQINRLRREEFVTAYCRRASAFFVRIAEADVTQLKFVRGWHNRLWRLLELMVA